MSPTALTGEQFAHWIEWMGISKTKAAEMLGVSRQSVYDWTGGATPCPPMLSLACAALAHGLRGYSLPNSPVTVHTVDRITHREPEAPVVLAAPPFGFGQPGDD